MLIMTIVLLAVVFVAGLIHTLFNFPTKKFMDCLQSLVIKTTPHVSTKPTIAQKKVKSGNANKAELKSLFATFDKNNDGFITKQELGESLKNIGILMTEKEVVDIVDKVDSNGDGLIDLDEFCESMVNQEEMTGELRGKEEEEDKEEADLKEAFDVFDGNGDGLITVEELGLVLSSMGLKEGKRLENCQEMIRKVDMDGDGMVNFDEFKSMMKARSRRLVPLS